MTRHSAWATEKRTTPWTTASIFFFLCPGKVSLTPIHPVSFREETGAETHCLAIARVHGAPEDFGTRSQSQVPTYGSAMLSSVGSPRDRVQRY